MSIPHHAHMACHQCEDFYDSVLIEDPEHLKRILDAAENAVGDGRLTIDAGHLRWEDIVHCKLHCTSCSQQFEVSCETYRGRGGRWIAIELS